MVGWIFPHAMPSANSIRESRLSLVIRASVCALLGVLALTAGTHLDFRQPFVGYGFGGAFLLYLVAERIPKRLTILAALGALFTAWVVWGRYQDLATLLVQVLGAFGLASLLLFSCVIVCNGRNGEPAAYRALLPAAVLAFFVLASQYSLNMASLLHRNTYDLYAFAFDGSLGFEPSFALGRFLNSHPYLFPFMKVSYEGILLAMAALYAGFMRRRDKPIWEIIEVLFASAMVGYAFFSIFPVCGPRYAFGRDFPDLVVPYASFHRLALAKVPVSWLFPRNGVPSLHLTWALLIWLNTRSLPRWARWAAWALVLATVFDTLASGEHYLFDLVVALPFTLWMQAWMARTVSIQDRRRWLPALCGCALFLAWLALGRFGFRLMMIGRTVPWLLVAVSSTVSIVWAMRLPAMIPEMQAHPRNAAATHLPHTDRPVC
ncbi:MAG: phosphatase PAP2 family protein [Terriglobales bacterium]